MNKIRGFRQRLDGNPPGSVRAVGEAALLAELHAHLFAEDFGAARELVAEYGSRVEDESNKLALDLASVSLLEQSADYSGALLLLESIITSLPPEEAELAEELGWSLSVIADKAEQQAGGRTQAPSSAVASALGETVTTYTLEAAYPNPFNPSVAVPFAVREAAHVEIELYDVLGRRVAVLANSLFDAGRHTIRFDGSNLASGIYVLRAVMGPEAGGTPRSFTQRLTLLK